MKTKKTYSTYIVEPGYTGSPDRIYTGALRGAISAYATARREYLSNPDNHCSYGYIVRDRLVGLDYADQEQVFGRSFNSEFDLETVVRTVSGNLARLRREGIEC